MSLKEPELEPLRELLSQICRLNRKRMHALLDEIGLYGGQPHVLRALWDKEGLTHSELAQRLHRSAATITNTLKRMEKAGFVERRSDPADERVSRVYLAEAGRLIRDRVHRVWREIAEQSFAGFSEQERDRLKGYLVRVRDNLWEGKEQ
jgi:DNA-binding MarR family transcriptional regulator